MNRIQELIARIKTLEDVGTTFAIAGFLLVGVGGWLDFQVMVNLGFAGFGAGVVAWGINAMQRGEMTPLRGFHPIARAESLLARAWGLLFTLGGLLLMGHGILSVLNPRSPIPTPIRQFFSTPQGSGVLLLVGSAVGILFALSMIFASDAETRNTLVRFLLSLPGRLIGMALLVFFGSLAAIAILQISNPTTFDTIAQSVYGAMGITP